MISILIYLIVLGVIFWLLQWLLGVVNPPEPFKKVATVILAVVVVLILIDMLLGLAGHPRVLVL